MLSTSNLAARNIGTGCNVRFMSATGDRVRAKRAELGLSQSELGKRAGGISYQAVQQVEAGGGSKHIVAIARALGVTAEWLQTGTGETINQPARKYGGHTDSLSQPDANNLIRVLGMAECGPDGWSLWNGEVIDHVPRPPNLAGATNAYAVYATGGSMAPRYLAGELVYIHPGKPVTPGCFVLVQMRNPDDGSPPRAFLKRLVRRSGAKVVLEQFDPPKSFNLAVDEIVSMHRVVGSGEA